MKRETLNRIRQCKDSYRLREYYNEYTSGTMLIALCFTDELKAVMLNPFTPFEVLSKAIFNPSLNWVIRAAAYSNPKYPYEILMTRYLGCKTDIDVLMALASRAETDEGLLGEIYRACDEVAFHTEVLQRLAMNPKAPKEMLDKLSMNACRDVRLEVSRHPKASKETLMRLVFDDDAEVSKSAGKRLLKKKLNVI